MPGLPSFKDFLQGLKDDLKGTIMYVAFLVIVVLFGILQAASKKNTVKLEKEVNECRTESKANAYTCKVENDQVRSQLVELLGEFKEMKGEMNTLRKLGILK